MPTYSYELFILGVKRKGTIDMENPDNQLAFTVGALSALSFIDTDGFVISLSIDGSESGDDFFRYENNSHDEPENAEIYGSGREINITRSLK